MTQTSREFAEALFELAMGDGNIEEVSAALDLVEREMTENPGYLSLLASPALSQEERKAVLSAAYELNEHTPDMERDSVSHQDRRRRGNRNRQQPVLAVYRTRTLRQVRDDHICDTKVIDTYRSCRNVQDRIHRSDFMKMNMIDRFAMDL